MAKKDPAFLFYSDDFIIGTMEMSHEEKGMYIDLLCFQHQKGWLKSDFFCSKIGSGITAENARNFSGKFAEVVKKFTINKSGNYTYFYNKRLDYEIKKRAEYVDSRRANASGKRQAKSFSKNEKALKENYFNKKAYASHMGNGNGIKKEGMQGEKTTISKDYIMNLGKANNINSYPLLYGFYISITEKNYQPASQAQILKDLKTYSAQRKQHKRSTAKKTNSSSKGDPQNLNTIIKGSGTRLAEQLNIKA